MKTVLMVAFALLSIATSAQAAEVWTCTYTYTVRMGTPPEPWLIRLEVSPPDLIDSGSQQHYRILQNNDYGLVATLGISEIQAGQKDPTIGAVSIVINKGTGEFWWNTTISGPSPEPNGSSQGKCLKD